MQGRDGSVRNSSVRNNITKSSSVRNSSARSSSARSSSARRKRRRRRQRICRIKQALGCVAAVFLICGGIIFVGTGGINDRLRSLWNLSEEEGQEIETVQQAEKFLKSQKKGLVEEYPKELLELLEKNPETYDFVTSYPEREKYQGQEIDLTGEVAAGDVPLFLQWDRRWGYDRYGNEMIALAGCGPTCMSMAYIYLTGETDLNPKAMAEFADKNGYNTEAGTSWNFFTDGAGQLGLSGAEIGLDEAKMKEVLDRGEVIICSMRPGDFTTTGHFILIRGYDKKGFWVNDPNSRTNSAKQWNYETLYPQIKCLWSIGN